MKRLVAVLASWVLILSFLPGTVAAHQSCADTKIRLYEGYNLAGDSVVLCGTVRDLNNVTHSQPGNCDNTWLGDGSWDDCASSFKVVANVHGYCIGIYSNPLGWFQWPLLEGGILPAGYWSNFDSGENNVATSVEFYSSNMCGGNP